MSRRSSTGWLIALILLVSLGLVVFVVAPIRSCPTCRGLAKKLAATKGYTDYRVECPDCADRGTVTQARYLKGSLLAPQLTKLLRGLRDPVQADFLSNLEQVAVLAGQEPELVSGRKFFSAPRTGSVLFRRTESRDVVVVVLQERGLTIPGDSAVGIVLLSFDGRVLDFAHVGCSTRLYFMTSEILDDAPDKAVVAIELRDRLGNGEPGEVICATMKPEPEKKTFKLKSCRVGLKGERLSLTTSEAPRAGP